MSIPLREQLRAVCADIDGTLLDSRRELSPRTIATIGRIKATIPVILASSRMPAAMRHLQQELGITNHPLICYNGGYVLRQDGAQPEVLDSVVIPVSICREILRLTTGSTLHVSLYEQDNWYAPGYDKWTEREARITKVTPQIDVAANVLPRWEQVGTGAHKVMCMGPEEEISTLQEALERGFSTAVHAYRSKSTYLEIAPRAISKASAMELVLKICYGLNASNALAFGDNYNDMDMLASAGWGIAVANAREEVKVLAKEITEANIDDGVAQAIERHLL
ncbi:Cof-type HAD-IIB family hydrolase [Fulvivirgaceae bacterium PWU5]|uniref:Cof-type HAD-IIB family hydrolase n=1 Tax=Dawidia cretensis TaxID=2782350 RepID=A0AAP2DUB1_9BACT|nr:Cof-type HAD-IIB family hydrolase [Dawidia cretensis]MBT1707551.1 Cof-type HAD-IIB family hydrolase [Dawidia cretensis]